ncbi:MAG: flagellar biosynthesis protein FliQ [Elusimicrobiota bacterium]
MDLATAISIMQDAIFVSLRVPAPILIAVLVVGVVITLFQAATQIHEMTLVFVPKMIVTYALLCIFGNWMLFTLINFGHRLFASIPSMIR